MTKIKIFQTSNPKLNIKELLLISGIISFLLGGFLTTIYPKFLLNLAIVFVFCVIYFIYSDRKRVVKIGLTNREIVFQSKNGQKSIVELNMIKLINFQYNGSVTNGSKMNHKYTFSFYTIYNERFDLRSGDFSEEIGDIVKIIKIQNAKVTVDEVFLADKKYILNFFNSDYKKQASKEVSEEQKEELIKMLKSEGINLDIKQQERNHSTLQDIQTANNILKFIKKLLKSSNNPIAKILYFVVSTIEGKIKMTIFMTIGVFILITILSIVTTIFGFFD